MRERDRFLSVFTMVSRIPVKAKFDIDFSHLDFWLPAIGVFPALLSGLVVLALRFFFPAYPLIIALAALGAQYFCFNLFHLDGLMDTADAFLGTSGPEKRRQILKDSRIGVYGFFAGLLVFLFKLTFLASLVPFEPYCFFVLFAAPVSGRAAAALVPVIAPPLSETGLGALAKNSTLGRVLLGALAGVLCWLVISTGILWLADFLGLPDITPGFFRGEGFLRGRELFYHLLLSTLPFLAVFTAFPVARLYRKGIGGYTGDTLGAAIEIGETVHLALVFLLVRALR